MKPQWFQILLSLSDRPRHGLAIQEDVLERTGGEMRLWPATLYRSLKKLEDKGLIAPVPAPAAEPAGAGQPNFYALTEPGRAALRGEVERLQGYVSVARARGVEL